MMNFIPERWLLVNVILCWCPITLMEAGRLQITPIIFMLQIGGGQLNHHCLMSVGCYSTLSPTSNDMIRTLCNYVAAGLMWPMELPAGCTKRPLLFLLPAVITIKSNGGIMMLARHVAEITFHLIYVINYSDFVA